MRPEAGWPVNGPFGCPSPSREEVGGTHRPLSLGQADSVVWKLQCVLRGDLDPSWAWPPAVVASWTAHAATVCRPRTNSSSSVSPPPPCSPPAVPAAPEIFLQLQRCYCIPFRTVSETLVKIPSFPLWGGGRDVWATPPCSSLLWVSGKAPVHTHPFPCSHHPEPNRGVQGLCQCLVRKHEGFRGEF